MSELIGLTVRDDVTSHEYVAELAGVRAGIAAYRREGAVTTFTHTVVEPSAEGRGVGSALVGAALAAERAAGRRVLALCPFVRAYLRRHPDDADVVEHG